VLPDEQPHLSVEEERILIMAKGNFNYAGPGAVVGIQAGNIVISGGIRVGDDDVIIDGVVVIDDEDGE
jgi:hypothetical protein